MSVVRIRTVVLLGIAVLASAPRPAAALQAIGGDCMFESGTELVDRQASGATMILFVRIARIRCAGGVILRADSLTYYDARGYAELIGNVFYQDTTRTLTAARASYYRDAGRLIANGDSTTDVVVTDLIEGGRLHGRNLDFIQAVGGRAQDEITVTGNRADGGRPNAVLPVDPPPEAEPDAPEPDPFDVTADRIFLRGENYFEASGDVDVVRDSLVTHSDSLVFDQVSTTLDLRGDAELVQAGDSIAGRRVRVRLPENEIREIEAYGEASLVSRDLDLDAPWFRIDFVDGQVDGLWAAPLRRQGLPARDSTPADAADRESSPETLPQTERREETEDREMTPRDSLDMLQPVAVSGGTRIRADSLDVAATVGVLDSLRAIGRAHAVSRRDSIDASMLPDIAKEDWIRGDTIVATLTASAVGDSTVYSVDRIVSAGNASSLYRLQPDTTAQQPDSAAVSDSVAPLAPDTATGVTTPGDSLPGGVLPGDSLADDSLARPDSLQEGGDGDAVVVLPSDAPGVHYVVAERIILVFENDEVRRMEIFGLREGVHTEPRRRATTPAPTAPGGPP